MRNAMVNAPSRSGFFQTYTTACFRLAIACSAAACAWPSSTRTVGPATPNDSTNAAMYIAVTIR